MNFTEALDASLNEKQEFCMVVDLTMLMRH